MKGGNIRESILGVLRFRTDGPEGEWLQVRYARDVWQTNGTRVRILLVVLSNFHVQSFSSELRIFFYGFSEF